MLECKILDQYLAVREGVRRQKLSSWGKFPCWAWAARLGSLMVPRTRREILSLVTAAANAGITLFDTADIYGQGESERILGEALKFIDACIVTVAGLGFPFTKSFYFHYVAWP